MQYLAVNPLPLTVQSIDGNPSTTPGFDPPMTRNVTIRGTCPHCETSLSSRDVLIEYETDTGTAAYADCPGCREVVNPA